MDTAHTRTALRFTALAIVVAVGFGDVASADVAAELNAVTTIPAAGIDAMAPAVPAPLPTATAERAIPALDSPEDAMIAWAKGLFSDAGLALPEVDVSFHAGTEPCRGAEGRWEHADGVTDRVIVCTTHEKPHVQDEWRRRTLVHELAHAWAARNLDGASKDRFVNLRGLAAWYDGSAEWSEQGAEHAAEIISWGIIDAKIHLWQLPNATCPAMAAGYYTLTGMEPETGLPDSCRP